MNAVQRTPLRPTSRCRLGPGHLDPGWETGECHRSEQANGQTGDGQVLSVSPGRPDTGAEVASRGDGEPHQGYDRGHRTEGRGTSDPDTDVGGDNGPEIGAFGHGAAPIAVGQHPSASEGEGRGSGGRRRGPLAQAARPRSIKGMAMVAATATR